MFRSPRLAAALATISALGRTSAEMAFYFALSFVPFVGLTVTAAIAWLPAKVGEPLAQALITTMPPEAGLDRTAIATWIGSVRQSGWLAAGVLVAAWSSFRFMTAGVRALADVGRAGSWTWGQQLRSLASAVLLTALWVTVLLAMAFVLLAAPGLRETLIASGWLGADAPSVATLVRTLALTVLLIALAVTYRTIPGLGARGVRLWIGAGLATAGWVTVVEGVRRLLPAIWGQRSLYGALGGFMLFLLWAWANAWVILAGGLLAGRRRRTG